MEDVALTVVAFALIWGLLTLLDRLGERSAPFLPERLRWAICAALGIAGVLWAVLSRGDAYPFGALLTLPLFVMILRRTGEHFATGPRDPGTGFYGGP